jgi:hypothetical protein
VTLPELEDLPLRQRHRREAGLDDPGDDYQPVPWTEARSNGAAVDKAPPLSTPETRSKSDRLSCALDGCDQPVTGRLAKYCSTAHQRRASKLRTQARDDTVEKAGAAQALAELGLVPNESLGNVYAAISESSVFASMASLAAALPVGWRLELGAGQACLRWSV